MSRKKSEANAQSRPITRADIESKVRAVQADFEAVKESTAGLRIAAGLGVALLLVFLAFLIGRRRGKQKYSFIEVRRA